MRPLVSVVCPTFNRSAAITATIASVQAQTVTQWELIVVSDGSTDDTDEHVTAAVRADRRIRLVRLRHYGHPAQPRNAGVALAAAPVVAYLDHDDRWAPEHLELVLGAIDAGADLAATGCQYVSAAGQVVLATAPLHLLWHPEIQLMGPTWEPTRVAHRRALLEQVGGWRCGPGVEDWDLWVRMADRRVRVHTDATHTAYLLADESTRRHSLRWSHVVALREFGSRRDAQEAITRLRACTEDAVMRTAVARDTEQWFARMCRSGELVTPVGWQADVMSAITEYDHGLPSWQHLVVRARGDRYVVGRPAACQTRRHAQRMEVLAARIRVHQRALIDRVLA